MVIQFVVDVGWMDDINVKRFRNSIADQADDQGMSAYTIETSDRRLKVSLNGDRGNLDAFQVAIQTWILENRK